MIIFDKEKSYANENMQFDEKIFKKGEKFPILHFILNKN